MKAQFRITRRKLIEDMKVLRQQRAAIKGNPDMKEKYRQLGEVIVETQSKIDRLSASLGLPVMTTKNFARAHGIKVTDKK